MKTSIRRFLLSMSVLLLLAFQLAQPAFADTTVELLPEHVGATNPGFEVDEESCGPNPTAPFMWRFALVWIDPGTSPGVLTATFEHAGVIVNSSPVLFGGGNEQKFWVYTETADTLLGAAVTVPEAQSGDPREPALKLSGVQQGCTPPPAVLASAGAQLGACAFDDTSATPLAITISPDDSVTVTLVDAADQVVATTSRSTTVSLAPGTYEWSGEAADGFTLAGESSGTVVAHACAPIVPGAAPPRVLPTKLPETGAPLGLLSLAGLGLVGLGALMIAAERGTLVLVPVRRWSRPVSAATPGALWLTRASLGRVVAVLRGGVWRPRTA